MAATGVPTPARLAVGGGKTPAWINCCRRCARKHDMVAQDLGRSSRPCRIWTPRWTTAWRRIAAASSRLSPAAVARGPAPPADDLRPHHRGDRARLLPAATIAQRIVRAKRTLSESGLAYGTPAAKLWAARFAGGGLSHLQRGLYRGAQRALAACNRHDAAHGPRDHLDRTARARSPWAAGADELRLAHRGAHRPCGPILLLEQNRALWDQLQIRRGCWRCARAKLDSAGGFYALQAASSPAMRGKYGRETGRAYRHFTRGSPPSSARR